MTDYRSLAITFRIQKRKRQSCICVDAIVLLLYKNIPILFEISLQRPISDFSILTRKKRQLGSQTLIFDRLQQNYRNASFALEENCLPIVKEAEDNLPSIESYVIKGK